MGYRSEVLLALNEKCMKKLMASFDDTLLLEVLSGSDRHEKDGWTLIHWNDVKWYDGYKDVDAINTFVADLEDSEDEEENEGYAFHILGEDQDDYTMKGNWDTPFEIQLHRSIDFFT
jgi:hypothetical protein